MNQKILLHTYDLPDHVNFSGSIAIDTEAMGLRLYRDRLCVVQIADEKGQVHLVHFPEPIFDQSPNLKKVLQDPLIKKILHYARFDMTILMYSFNMVMKNIFCTKIASYLVRTYTEKHGLADLCKTLLGVNLAKKEQTSDWGRSTLTAAQKNYASCDVIYLHALKEKLEELLRREKRCDLAQACFQFLPHRCQLDIMAGEGFDVFSYKLSS
jgi:ribonuclease D